MVDEDAQVGFTQRVRRHTSPVAFSLSCNLYLPVGAVLPWITTTHQGLRFVPFTARSNPKSRGGVTSRPSTLRGPVYTLQALNQAADTFGSGSATPRLTSVAVDTCMPYPSSRQGEASNTVRSDPSNLSTRPVVRASEAKTFAVGANAATTVTPHFSGPAGTASLGGLFARDRAGRLMIRNSSRQGDLSWGQSLAHGGKHLLFEPTRKEFGALYVVLNLGGELFVSPDERIIKLSVCVFGWIWGLVRHQNKFSHMSQLLATSGAKAEHSSLNFQSRQHDK